MTVEELQKIIDDQNKQIETFKTDAAKGSDIEKIKLELAESVKALEQSKLSQSGQDKRNTELTKELEAERKNKMTVEEQLKAKELKRDTEIQMLLSENAMAKLKDIARVKLKAAGLDDSSLELVMANSEAEIEMKTNAFKKSIDAQVEANVKARLEKSGYVPGSVALPILQTTAEELNVAYAQAVKEGNGEKSFMLKRRIAELSKQKKE